MTEEVLEIIEASADIIEIVSEAQEILEIVDETSVVEIVEVSGQDIIEVVQDSSTTILEVVIQPEEILEIIESNVPGPTGPTGPSGAPGGTSLIYTAGQILSGHRMVIVEDSLAYYADCTTAVHAHRVAGMTLGAAAQNAAVTIQTGGLLEEPSWAWTIDTPVWLSTQGLLTQTPPLSGFSLIIGFPISATSLYIDIREPIFLT